MESQNTGSAARDQWHVVIAAHIVSPYLQVLTMLALLKVRSSNLYNKRDCEEVQAMDIRMQ